MVTGNQHIKISKRLRTLLFNAFSINKITFIHSLFIIQSYSADELDKITKIASNQC